MKGSLNKMPNEIIPKQWDGKYLTCISLKVKSH